MSKTKDLHELAKLQWEFLNRNHSFLQEYERYREKTWGEISPAEFKQHVEARNMFLKRWGIQDEVMRCLGVRLNGQVPLTRRRSLSPHDPTLIIEVNLAYPLKELMEHIELEIRWRQQDLRDGIREEIQENCEEELSPPELEQACDEFLEDMRCRHPLKRLRRDLNEYREALKVYDRREGKQSWRTISKELGVSQQTARNRYRQAQNYVKHGLPCFPPFPSMR